MFRDNYSIVVSLNRAGNEHITLTTPMLSDFLKALIHMYILDSRIVLMRGRRGGGGGGTLTLSN